MQQTYCEFPHRKCPGKNHLQGVLIQFTNVYSVEYCLVSQNQIQQKQTHLSVLNVAITESTQIFRNTVDTYFGGLCFALQLGTSDPLLATNL